MYVQIKKIGDLMKDTRLEIRLSDKHLELIKRVAKQCDTSVSALILSIVVPYCLKIDNNNKDN